jgi:hypothetical protein
VALTVGLRGDYWVTTLTAAAPGQKVFAVLDGGAAKAGDHGATIAGAIETQWFVVSAGAAGEVIKISNWAAPSLEITNNITAGGE